ncbi:peroxisomal multifunctional enzyme type 2 isoform X2 [Aplysia californica]|uniref:Peroxisomal multifunctional enzyme type 2 isoform X2 n=1 Tax=Aplysia californica TaxID=6500 RepID=A0ABM0JLK6_APLCA|nr:peroxisomal multifunctional enzyme type 2 isoform X2 [Aplysia californica]
MAQPLRFDGKVVLITGAGNGLGRSYALAFAERGASVVVNDLGGDHSGSGSGTKAADKVVFEIKSKGGKAVANYDSVEEGDKVVQTALDAFGRIDVVINNAGILRDRSFARISNEDWDIIHRVHLRGSFMVTRAAWPHMKKQGYGRIIMVSSSAGIYGNFGQANYSAAKLGLSALSKTLSLEGIKYNIRSNCIAPIAGSRLTETVMPPDLVAALKPEYVAPVVVYLCHDSCEETGGLFEIGAGWVGKLRWQRTEGVLLREKNKAVTAEAVRDNWDRITDFASATIPDGSNSFVFGLVNQVDEEERQDAEASQSSDPLARAKAFKSAAVKFSYTERDVILYALGVGTSVAQEDYLKFLFELSEDFSVIPSFGVIPAFGCLNESLTSGLPGFSVDPTKILHGEQYLELYKPIPPSGTLTSQLSVADILDKKSGALILYNVETFDENNEMVAFNQFSTFAVGSGNFGGPKTTTVGYPLAETPKRAPDAVMQEKTSVDQAALYRLSGDRNPLHIDPSFAAMGGFKTPILHGLCSFGHSVRHVMKTFANNDMSKFKSVKVRFSKPVLPGQSLRTEMWREGNRILFQTKIVENGNICISGAYVDLKEVANVSKPVQQNGGALRSSGVFQHMATQLRSQSGLVAKVNAVYQWNITQEGKPATSWIVDLKNSKTGEVYEGSVRSGKVDCTITVSDDNFMNLVAGKLDPQKAFMTGKLKLSGNIMLAQKLGDLFALSSKM